MAVSRAGVRLLSVRGRAVPGRVSHSRSLLGSIPALELRCPGALSRGAGWLRLPSGSEETNEIGN